MGSKVLKKIAKFALPIAGAAFGGPAGAALGGAAGGLIGGGGLKGAAIGGLTGFAGNAIGNSLASSISGGLGKLGGTTIGSALGKTSSNAIGNSLLSTTFGGGLAKFAGNSIADNLVGGAFGEAEVQGQPNIRSSQGGPTATPEPSPFEPTREPQLQLPGSLSSFNSLDPNQQSSNIATQGVYGGGNGPEEENFFTNMINRRLVDDSGQVDQDLSEINPIESSYLSQLGLGGYTNPSSLLEALYGRNKAQISA